MLSDDEKQLMNLILNNSQLFKDKLLTERDIKILQFVKKRKIVTSVLLMTYLDCSIQSASGVLQRLYNKKYLQRVDIPCPTGGFYHKYRENRELIGST